MWWLVIGVMIIIPMIFDIQKTLDEIKTEIRQLKREMEDFNDE